LAWEAGHKAFCPELKLQFKNFEESLSVVDEASIKGTMHGIAIAPPLDYRIERLMHSKMMIRKSNSFSTTLEIPRQSMTLFYVNLGRIVRKEWWPLYYDFQGGVNLIQES
jgi:hypothetical protein